ncbi:DUF1249 domain-containing protein [Thalassotalea sp. ND16A]|uniref:DUF1249 domain-containing protein n=1 Tax=Thalassotalea sp. ND16A TaxID=1535422 RepID=UPI00051A1A76|nr:DUF1249 domain-containing protein [Thalassotalea sp. ND16A]KGJ89308.1 hypothetical protein ND16A_2201 [Thalassotalea sp. ND16A]
MAQYKPSLKGLNNSYENNFILLSRLLAGMDDAGEMRSFFINELLEYSISIVEKTKYTHVVEFKQLVSKSESLASKVHLPKPSMLIRIYYDAHLAEVIESQFTKQIKPRYDYPNPQMHLPDEKQQAQQFLTEWLRMCLTQGRANIEISNK